MFFPLADVTAVAFRPDSKVVAVAFGMPTPSPVVTPAVVRFWDATTGAALDRRLDEPTRVNALAYSPDGRRLATGLNGNAAQLWDAEAGARLGSALPHSAPVGDIGFTRTARPWSRPA